MKIVHLVGFIIKNLTRLKLCFIAPRGLQSILFFSLSFLASLNPKNLLAVMLSYTLSYLKTL